MKSKASFLVLQLPLLFPGSPLWALVRVVVLLLGSKSVGLMEALSLGEAHIPRAEPVPPSPGTWVRSRGLSARLPLSGGSREVNDWALSWAVTAVLLIAGLSLFSKVEKTFIDTV